MDDNKYNLARCNNCGFTTSINYLDKPCMVCGEIIESVVTTNSLQDIMRNDNIKLSNLNSVPPIYKPLKKDIRLLNNFKYKKTDRPFKFDIHVFFLFAKNEDGDKILQGLIFTHNHYNYYRLILCNDDKLKIIRISLDNLQTENMSLIVTKIPFYCYDTPTLDKNLNVLCDKSMDISNINDKIFKYLKINKPSKYFEYHWCNCFYNILSEVYGIELVENSDVLKDVEFFTNNPYLISKTEEIKDNIDFMSTSYKDVKHIAELICSYNNINNIEDILSYFNDISHITYDNEVYNYDDTTSPYITRNLMKAKEYSDFLRINRFYVRLYEYYMLAYCGYAVNVSITTMKDNSGDIKIKYIVPYFAFYDNQNKGIGSYIIENNGKYVLNITDNVPHMISIIKSHHFKTIKYAYSHATPDDLKLICLQVTPVDMSNDKVIKLNLDDSELDVINKLLILNKKYTDEKLNEDFIFLNEAPQTNNKRQKIEKVIYDTFNILDKTGANTKKYKELFNSMNDDQFNSYMKTFLKDKKANFYLEVLPNKNEPSLSEIEKALEYLDVPKDEYVYFRDGEHKDNPIRTRYKVPVGYVTLKRMQQVLSKKNTYSLDINKRALKTNQVTGDDKIARLTDQENYMLSAIGANNAMKEFLGPRADSADAKMDLYKNISMYGYAYMKDLSNDINEKQTINTVSAYLIGCGIKTDLLEKNTEETN